MKQTNINLFEVKPHKLFVFTENDKKQHVQTSNNLTMNKNI